MYSGTSGRVLLRNRRLGTGLTRFFEETTGVALFARSGLG